MKQFNCYSQDPGALSREADINTNYEALNLNVEKMGKFVNRDVKVHFIRCLTPQEAKLDNLIGDLELIKKGQKADADTIK